MILTRAIFDKYDRFYLNPELKSFTIEPSKGVIVVAGDNGSGKSTLCRCMMPWPLSKGNVDDGGSVIREWTHTGLTYTDSYVNGQYSFCMNGVELNPGAGLRVQEGLFTEHFGTDLPLVKVLAGVDTFTSMSPKVRQYWMSRLDSFQLERLEGVVRKLKENKKEQEILLKYHNSQLGKFTSTASIESLQSQRTEIATNLDKLLSVRFSKQSGVSLDTSIRQYRNLQSNIKAIQAVVRNTPRYISNTTEEQVRNTLSGLVMRRRTCVDRLMELSEAEVSVEGLPSVAECNDKINTLSASIIAVSDIYDNPGIHQQYLQASSMITANGQMLGRTMYAPGDLTDALVLVNNVTGQVDVCKTNITRLEMSIQQTEDGILHPVTCPMCNHEYGLHGNEVDLQDMIQELKDTKADLVTLELKLADVRQLHTNISEHLHGKNALHVLLSGLSPEYVRLLDKPTVSGILLGISDMAAQLDQAYKNKHINAEISRYKEYLSLHILAQSQHVAKTATSRQSIEDTLRATDAEIVAAENLLIKVRNYCNHVSRCNKFIDEQAALSKSILTQMQVFIDSGLDNAVTESILALRPQLSMLDGQIVSYEDTLVKHREATDAVAKCEGLLQTMNESLTVLDGKVGFIGHLYKQRICGYIDRMNLTIQELWGYRMKIHTPPDSMNFRFPIEIEGMMRDDISQGSKGMQEIINLAFILLVRDHCGATHLPFILDEFGSALDAAHLDKAYQYLSTYSADQLWLVSHLADITQLFDDSIADYVALSTRHIPPGLLPATTNDILTGNS